MNDVFTTGKQRHSRFARGPLRFFPEYAALLPGYVLATLFNMLPSAWAYGGC